MSTIRQKRVADRIREELSELFLRDMNDPRLAMVTITDVTVDRELAYAKIYVNALGAKDRKEEILEALEHAKGYLRRHIGSRIRLRRTPDMRFLWDTSLEHEDRINELLDSLRLGEEEE